MTYDIIRPRQHQPIFAPRCVVCERENPTSSARVSVLVADSGPSLVEVLVDTTTKAQKNTTITLNVPTCPGCKPKLEHWHRNMQIAQYLGAFGGVALLAWMLTLGQFWLGMIFLAAGVLLPVVAALRWPPAFGLTGMGGQISYEFTSQRCSEEFSTLNPPKE
jgi:hypothetical protein